MTAKDFLAYVEETTRNELWIDHAAWYLGKDVYITAGVSIKLSSLLRVLYPQCESGAFVFRSGVQSSIMDGRPEGDENRFICQKTRSDS